MQTEVVHGIQTQWQLLKEKMVGMVTQWTEQCQRAEVAYFLERGEVELHAGLAELEDRMTQRRHEMLNYHKHIDKCMSEKELSGEQELLARSIMAKSLLREVWDRNYEFEVRDMLREQAQLLDLTAFRRRIHCPERNK